MEKLFDRKVPAASLFSGPYYFLEQLGFRKVIDTTFMMASMITGEPDPEDVRKYFRALRRAQRDIDLRPELYTHYYKKEFPERFHAMMDTRRWGPGERIVFEPYTKQVFEDSFRVDRRARHLPRGGMGTGTYENSIFSVAAESILAADLTSSVVPWHGLVRGRSTSRVAMLQTSLLDDAGHDRLRVAAASR